MLTLEQTNDYCRKIAKAVQIPMAIPRGRKHANLQEYLSRFDNEQLTFFIDKLAKSKYVKSTYFSMDKLITEDIVSEIIAGGIKQKEAINRYYNPVVLVISGDY